jgi:hypothetical protein
MTNEEITEKLNNLVQYWVETKKQELTNTQYSSVNYKRALIDELNAEYTRMQEMITIITDRLDTK